MSYPNGLNEHRLSLKNNNLCFIQDKERAINNWCKHSYEFIKTKTTFKKTEIWGTLNQMAELVWEAQEGKPLFHFLSVKNDMPMSWNRPQNGADNYIRYEIGHINPIHTGGTSHPNNLCFQSARCNQHIQSSLDIEEVILYFSSIHDVLERINRLKILHKSEEWNLLLIKLGL